MCNCADSNPAITASVTDRCIPQGRNVSLTCKVTYKGTNLMPLIVGWFLSIRALTRPESCNYNDYIYLRSTSTVNESSVFQSSATFTDNETLAYWCRVTFSHLTGLVIPGVERSQYLSRSNAKFWSTPFASRAVASKTTVHVFTLQLKDCLLHRPKRTKLHFRC